MEALEKIPCIGGICIGAGWNLGMYRYHIFLKGTRVQNLGNCNFAGIEKRTEHV